MSREPDLAFQTTLKILLGVLLGVSVMFGAVILTDPPKPTRFDICFLTQGGEKTCAYVDAKSYTMDSGCATFSNGSTVCHVLGISVSPSEKE